MNHQNHEPFSWSSLAIPERDWLRDRTAAIKLGLRQSVTNLLLIGSQLQAVRLRLGGRLWRSWLSQEFSITRRTARRLMSIASLFAAVEPETLERIDRSALYALCERNVPPEARERAVEIAREGQLLTHAEAKELVVEFTARAVGRPAKPKKLKKSDEVFEARVIVEESKPDPLRVAVQTLLANGGMLHLSATHDSEDNTTTVFARHQPADGPPSQVTRNTAEEALLALAGVEPTYYCSGCGHFKTAVQFSADSTQTNGRNRRCRLCERNRLTGRREQAVPS